MIEFYVDRNVSQLRSRFLNFVDKITYKTKYDIRLVIRPHFVI